MQRLLAVDMAVRHGVIAGLEGRRLGFILVGGKKLDQLVQLKLHQLIYLNLNLI